MASGIAAAAWGSNACLLQQLLLIPAVVLAAAIAGAEHL